LKVRIIKAHSSSYWYANKIGSVFPVKVTPTGYKVLQRIPTPQALFRINKGHLEVWDNFIDFEDARPLKATRKTKKVSVNPKPNKVPDITENGATRLMAALAGDTIREKLLMVKVMFNRLKKHSNCC
jgi:hypothetical protein